MDSSLHTNLVQLKEILRQHNQEELEEVKEMLEGLPMEIDSGKIRNESLKELLLKGPTLSKEELARIKEARNMIRKWRTG